MLRLFAFRREVMTPEQAVTCLAETVTQRVEFSENDIYEALSQAGIPDHLADRAYKFTQCAWGRVLLDGMGIRFSPDFLLFDKYGKVVESGRLADEPNFVVASRLADRHKGTPGFRRLVLMSADFHAVNAALNAGSHPENLVMSPMAAFIEKPLLAALGRVQETLADHCRKASNTIATDMHPPKETPWWRFWK
jgi:hypothetical protein